MKNAFFKFLTLSYILVFFFSCIPLGEEKETIIDIKDFRDKKIPSPLALHKYKDVEIFRVGGEIESYAFAIYGIENDSLKIFTPFVVGLNEDFNKASYYWDSDTVLLVRFYNTDSEKERKFRLSGDLINETGSGSSRCKIIDKK